MSVGVGRLFSVFSAVLVAGVVVSPAFAGIKKPIEAISGAWFEEKSSSEMVVIEKQGLFLVTGKDSKSSYSAACIVKATTMECVGHGFTKQDGPGFLYNSTMQMDDDGRLVENWIAKEKNENIKGKTMWRRKQTR